MVPENHEPTDTIHECKCDGRIKILQWVVGGLVVGVFALATTGVSVFMDRIPPPWFKAQVDKNTLLLERVDDRLDHIERKLDSL